MTSQFDNAQIDFDKMQGLVPAIVQDAASGEVLMLGFMNVRLMRRPSAPATSLFTAAPATSFGPRAKLPATG